MSRRRLSSPLDEAATAKDGVRSLTSSGINVIFTVSLDVREAGAVTGKTYLIDGPAGDDAWASDNSTMLIAEVRLQSN